MELHDDDVPGGQTPLQRAEFGKSVVLGVTAIVLGGVLVVVGIVHHQNPAIPAIACAAGVIIVVFDLTIRRSRRRRRGDDR